MNYQIKPIYNYTINAIDESTAWCSSPDELITNIHNNYDRRRGWIEVKYNKDDAKILKMIGIFLGDNLIRICETVEEAEQILVKLKNFSKKIEEMKLTGVAHAESPESIKFIDNDLFEVDVS